MSKDFEQKKRLEDELRKAKFDYADKARKLPLLVVAGKMHKQMALGAIDECISTIERLNRQLSYPPVTQFS